MIKPGVTTLEIDRMAEKLIRDGGAIPSSKGYEGFPYSICASVDSEVVHGFPSDVPLRDGQIDVSFDGSAGHEHARRADFLAGGLRQHDCGQSGHHYIFCLHNCLHFIFYTEFQ